MNQAFLDSLRKDLDEVSGQVSRARNRMNEARREYERLKRQEKKFEKLVEAAELL